MAKGKRAKEESEFHIGVLLVIALIVLIVVVGFLEVKRMRLKRATEDLGRLVDKIENEIDVTQSSLYDNTVANVENVINQEMTEEEKAEIERLKKLNNEISNEIIENTVTNITNTTNSTSNNKEDSKEIEERISKFINLYFDYKSNLTKFFKDLGINMTIDKSKVDDKGMFLSDVNYTDYTNKMLEIMSGEVIENKFVNIRSLTSKVYFDTKYAKENVNDKIDIKSIEFSKKDGNSLVYLVKVKENYSGTNNEVWYKVVTEKINNNYLILNLDVVVVK